MNKPLLWQNYHPVRVFAGEGSLSQLPDLLKGTEVLLVTSQGFSSRGTVAKIESLLVGRTIRVIDSVTPNPELEFLDNIIEKLKAEKKITDIVALGGGSVLDVAKVLAASLPIHLTTPLARHFREQEEVSWGETIPLITVPTTAGTGSEATPFATVWDKQSKSKYSLSGEFMFPSTALLDPELIASLPYHETLQTGLDAISHALESIWNINKTPVSLAYSIHAAKMLVESLPQALEEPENLNARAATQYGSFLAGLAISHTRTALAHSISYPLTSYFGVPHGLACSFSLPAIISEVLKLESLANDEREVLETVREMLLTLPIFSTLEKYVSWSDVFSLRSKMSNPQRAGNFILPVSDMLIESILNESKSLTDISHTT